MGTKLADFASDATTTGAPLRIPSKGKRLPKANIIGIALLPKNTLPDIGSATTFTPPPSGSPVAVTASNLVSILQALALNGQAWVFGNGVINGKKSGFKADEEPMVFGSRRNKRDTGEGESTYSIGFKYAYMNTTFFNQLRLTYTEYDIYVFTDRSVETVRYDLAEPVFKNVKNGEITGNNTDEISNGGFDIVVGTDGEIEPDFGLFENLLAISNFKYTITSVAVTGTGLTSTLSGTVINKTSSGSGTISPTLGQTIGTNVARYSLIADSGATVPAGVTIDTSTGIVTVGASVTAGSYKLRILVENQTGVMGEYGFTLVAS